MKKRIVILGGGFAGVECARRLEKHVRSNSSTEIALVSEDNFLLFTPLLPQVASGMVQTRNIVIPIRTILKKTKFYENRVQGIDPVSQKVSLWGTPERHGITLDYDFLVVALGSETNFFGMQDVEDNSFKMKTLKDAVDVRNRVIDILEQADNESDPDIKKSLLTIVIVGGGFAGIETAGELHDLLTDAVKYYHTISREEIHVIVLESGDVILPSITKKLSQIAHTKILQDGIDVRLRTVVVSFDGDTVGTEDVDGNIHDDIHTKTVIWTAGVTPVNTVKRSVFKTKQGKIEVDDHLEAKEYKNVFVAGDCALFHDVDGKLLPPTAQVASSQAKCVADNLVSIINGRPIRTYEFKHKSHMALIGKRSGIASLFGMSVGGILAWMMWRNLFITKVPTFSKKIRLILDWTGDAIFDRDISRLKFANNKKVKEYETEAELDDFW